MGQPIGLVESAWFFRRGSQYVRIVRVGRRDARLSLIVDGPEGAHVAHHFDDPLACAVHQCELERELVTRDFHLERASGMRPASNLVLTMPELTPPAPGPAAA